MDWRAFAAALLVVAPSLTLSGGPFISLRPADSDPEPEVRSTSIPASDSPDDATLAELGVERDSQAAAGGSSPP
jgi:hypothetical protein